MANETTNDKDLAGSADAPGSAEDSRGDAVDKGGMRGFLHRHKTAAWITGGVVGVLVIVAICLAVFVFEVQTIFINTTVDDQVVEVLPETSPEPAESPEAGETTTTAPAGPVLLGSGEFISLNHAGSGTAQVIEMPDGSRVLQFLNLDVSNGPDLRVIFSTSELVDQASAYSQDYYDLGDLRGNRGDQVYDIPADVDLSKYPTVAIWCRRFDSTFNAAPI